MKAGEIRSDLLNKIEHMNLAQLKAFYGLLQNYFNSNEHVENWDTMTAMQRKKIEKGITEADSGKTKPLTEIVYRLKQKYGLNG